MATSNLDMAMTSTSPIPASTNEEKKSSETPAAPGPQTVSKPRATATATATAATTTNRDIYSVEIHGTHIKVFMPSHMHEEMASIHNNQKQQQQQQQQQHQQQQQQQPFKRPRMQKQQTASEKMSSSKDKVSDDGVPNATTAIKIIITEAEDAVEIPESALHYERQLRKMQAATRASTNTVSPNDLQIIYNDPHIVVVSKPSGFLTVPGVNDNPNLLQLVYETLQQRSEEDAKILKKMEKMEHMIVHRLDMDTSGLVIFAKTKESMAQLQANFRQHGMDQTKNNRNKKRWKNRKKESRQHESQQSSGNTKPIQKEYEALLCGHIELASSPDDLSVQQQTNTTIQIELPLQRDHQHPPFMRVATPTSEQEAQEVVQGLKHAGWKKIVKKKAKPSQTLLQVLNREYVTVAVAERPKELNDDTEVANNSRNGVDCLTIGDKLPVTRVRLTPVTGRTHQLRVHCAAIGHPILADPTYGILGEAAPNGGFDTSLVEQAFRDAQTAPAPEVEVDDKEASGYSIASTRLKLQLDQWVKDHKQVMCLHARKLQLNHPITGEELCLEEAPKF